MKKYVLALLFFLPILTSTGAYADTQDVIYNFDGTTYEAVVCKNNDANLPACTDYQYMKFETDFVISNYYSNSMIIAYNGNNKTYLPVNTTVDLSLLPNLTQVYVAVTVINGTNSTATVTLTNSGCPDPEPCPECPLDCDDNLISRLFKSTFWNVATSLVGLIVPVLALFLIFRLVHDFFWGKG